jgi:hypothetical protein
MNDKKAEPAVRCPQVPQRASSKLDELPMPVRAAVRKHSLVERLIARCKQVDEG